MYINLPRKLQSLLYGISHLLYFYIFCATKTINKFLHIMRVICELHFVFTTNSLLRQLHKVLGSWSWKRLKWNYNMLKRNKAWHSSMASHSICMNKLYFTGAWQIYYVYTYYSMMCMLAWMRWKDRPKWTVTELQSKWASNYIHIYIGQ